MSKPKLHWPFWVGAGWTTIYAVYAAIQWLRDAPKTNDWLPWLYFAPVILCMWYQSILSSRDEEDRQESLIKAEVEVAVRKALKPNKVTKVVDTEAEKVDP